MKKFRSPSYQSFLCIFMLTLVIFMVSLSFPRAVKNGSSLAAPIRSMPSSSLQMKNNQKYVNDDFYSHLPLIIVDTNGQSPRADSEWDHEKQYYIPLEIDPYASGTIKIIDNKNSMNQLRDPATFQSNIKLRLRGNSSLNFDKKQYLIKLVDQDGNKNKQSLLDMEAEWEWVLGLSFIDKSLIRNFLAFSIGKTIMPFTSDVRYCEVLFKENDAYLYQGVYLLIESVKQSSGRVDIAEYSATHQRPSYILRRDRYDETGTILKNYGSLNNRVPSFLEIKYPQQEKINPDGIKKITNRIDEFERALFASDSKDYMNYKKHIDLNSFIDYFIINEFLLNYDAGFNSTYMHTNYTSLLAMGPIWDFDQAIDNNEFEAAFLETTAFHDAPWYPQLLRDPMFTQTLITRYHKLRQGVLSDQSIINFIEGTITYLQNAAKRDWIRWGYFYQETDFLQSSDPNNLNRNMKTYEFEINKIQRVLIKHATWLDEHIDSLYQFSDSNISMLSTAKLSEYINDIAGITFIAIFIISAVVIQREF